MEDRKFGNGQYQDKNDEYNTRQASRNEYFAFSKNMKSFPQTHLWPSVNSTSQREPSRLQ